MSTPHKEVHKVCIHIYYHERGQKMCDLTKKNKQNKFICSLCLNTKIQEQHNSSKRKGKTCPICQKTCDYCENAIKIENLDNTEEKVVQTSLTDVSQGLNLLNEVLSVFQTKKSDTRDGRTLMCKDAAISTESPTQNLRLGLSMSKMFKFSIKDGEKTCDHSRFTLLNSWQPELMRISSINIAKHKSSSIPQMKLDELKNSLKEKTKSKDAIEEVNRMFACVGKFDLSSNDSNRPMVRSGPRVLPVVKTPAAKKEVQDPDCRCRHVENYFMSSGDSKNTCTHCNCGCNCEPKSQSVNKCDKCVYMLSCHRNKKPVQEVMICDCCQKQEVCTRCVSN